VEVSRIPEVILQNSVVQRELNIGDLVLNKDIHTKDKHKFSSPWEGPFIIVDIAAPGAYVLLEVDDSMLPNISISCTNIMLDVLI
jgi:hypothetical protein